MIVIRPIEQKDAEAFIKIAFTADLGMTSIPKNSERLLQRIVDSERSFAASVQKPGNESYLFVLEDLKTGAIGGTSGITAKTALNNPLYFYRLEIQPKKSVDQTIDKSLRDVSIMRVIHYLDAPSEIGSLYLLPEFRREGFGRLLSIVRFLFVAAFPEKFDKMLFAEMRGYVDANIVSPFWEGIGKHFLNMDYKTIQHLVEEELIDISKVIPIYPIYVSLLPKKVQKSIGKIHKDTIPALNMLIQEGFYLSDEVDIFDGGPKVEAEVQKLRSVTDSSRDIVSRIASQPLEGPRYILSNDRIKFRACYSQLQFNHKGVCIPKEVAQALEVQLGDQIRYISSPSREQIFKEQAQ